MRERGILMSTPMVRATLRELDPKTQTRRVVAASVRHVADGIAYGAPHPGGFGEGGEVIPCPYGVPGDRLWLREAWRVARQHDAKPPRDLPPKTMTVFFEAGGSIANQMSGRWERDDWPTTAAERPDWVGRYRHARFMPRWASRITLEVTEVRIERLQDISEMDAVAEGIDRRGHGWAWYSDAELYTTQPVTSYRDLWEQINGQDSWEANPWVWVVGFKRLEA